MPNSHSPIVIRAAKRLVSSLALAGLLWCGQASAVVVENLYQAQVLTADQSDTGLRRGASAGLRQVLIRVSGSLDVEQSSEIRAALRTPAEYYYQYAYESADRETPLGEGTASLKLLRIDFDPSAVAKLLRNAGMPVWGSSRPGVLVWLASAGETGRRIVTEDDATLLVQSLMDQAQLRGVPLLFPLMDLDDAVRISPALVWGGFHDRVEEASVRYGPDAILTGRVQGDGDGQHEGRWSIKIGETWRTRELFAQDEDALARQMIDSLARALAARYALDSSRGRVRVEVQGLADLASYVSLSQYLESLTPVTSSAVVELDGEVAMFELSTEGQNEQLIKIIELDERMALLNQNETGTRLRYLWIR